ncbi:MAG: thiamine phosphate synthase [bacterium]
MPNVDLSLCVILDREIERDLPLAEFVRQVIEAGATCLQVRLKNEDARAIQDFTAAVMRLARPRSVPVIVNDRLDVALAAGADGVHVGETDLAVADVRRIAGPGLVVGASASGADVARRAAAAGADYVGMGPVFRSPSKPGVEPVGWEAFSAARRIISLPMVAIGGINHSNLHVPLDHGADGIAVISALRQCPSPGEAMSRLRRAFEEAKKR